MLMATKYSLSTMLVVFIALFSSMNSLSMQLSPELIKRAGIGVLALAANFGIYVGHEITKLPEADSDHKTALLNGIRVSWIAANLHLLRSFAYPQSVARVAERGGVLTGACFLTNAVWSYIDSKLSPKDNEGQVRMKQPAWKVGFRCAIGTIGVLANLGIFYDAIFGSCA
jgi:hypothetical protein